MRLLVLDTETTGLEAGKHKIIELAAAVYCTQSKEVVAQFGTLFYNDGNPCQEINHITQAMLDHFKGRDRTSDLVRLKTLSEMSRYIVAHNAEFDLGMVRADPQFEFLSAMPWVCSKKSLRYPKQRSSTSLSHLAADHGIFNPGAHRAIHDVLTLCELLKHCQNIEKQIEDSFKPRKTVFAVVSFDDRYKAKEVGFSWDEKQKKWTKQVTDEELAELNNKVTFKIGVFDGP